MDEPVRFRLELTQEDLDEERKQDSGLTIEQVEETDDLAAPFGRSRFVETVAVVAVATIAVLAERLVNHYLRSREEGVQIDLRKDPPAFSAIANVPRGFLVIIDRDGKATTQQADYDKPSDLIPLLQGLLKAKP